MPRTDKSVTILTGMIIAALYVILLIGFSRESYMRRDAAALTGTVPFTDGLGDGRVVYDASKQVCRVEPPLCAMLFPDEADRQNCMTSIEAIRRLVSEPSAPLTLEGLRRAVRAEP